MNKKIKYKYNIYYDIEWMLNTLRNKKWLKEKELIFFKPSIFRLLKLWFNRPKGPDIDVEFNVTCYWISSGTWGAYRPPNKIFICPHKIPNLAKVIRHEITHLKYNHDVYGMKHDDKEEYINKKESENFNLKK